MWSPSASLGDTGAWLMLGGFSPLNDNSIGED